MPKPYPKPMKPAGNRSAPSAKANPIAAARSHGQHGAAMRAMHAAPKAAAKAPPPRRKKS